MLGFILLNLLCYSNPGQFTHDIFRLWTWWEWKHLRLSFPELNKESFTFTYFGVFARLNQIILSDTKRNALFLPFFRVLIFWKLEPGLTMKFSSLRWWCICNWLYHILESKFHQGKILQVDLVSRHEADKVPLAHLLVRQFGKELH